MKKRSIALLITLLSAVTLLAACSDEKEKPSYVILQSEKTQESLGNFFLFRTQDSQEYLTFLENFDETKYEILDISTSYNYYFRGSDEFYIVTYKLLPETK